MCRVLCTCLAVLAVGLAGTPVRAAPADADTHRAQLLYDEGRILYEGRDYAGALAKWSDAYGLVSDAAENDRTRYELLYSIALAHEHAYGLDGDNAHLIKAQDLLLKCQAAVGVVFAGDADVIRAEQQRIKQLLDRVIGHRVAAGEQRPPATAPAVIPAPAPATDSVAPPGALPGPAPGPAPAPMPDRTPDPTADRNKAKAMLGVGLSLLGVGIAALAVMGAGMGIARRANDFSGLDDNDLEGREEQIRGGKRGNAMSVAGAITGGVMLVAGVALTASGGTRLRSTAHASLSPTHVMLGWSGSF